MSPYSPIGYKRILVRAVVLGLCVSILTACGGDSKAPAANEGKAAAPPAEAAPIRAPAPTPAKIEPVAVFVDDAPAATVTPEQLRSSPRLATLVGEGPAYEAWTNLASRAQGERRQTISDPSGRFADEEPVLFVDEATGTAAIGFVPRTGGEGAKPDKVLDGVFEVRISTKPPIDPEAAKELTIVVDGDDKVVEPATFESLPAASSPVPGKGGRREGWWLADVLRPRVDPAAIDSIRLVTADEQIFEIPGDAIRSDRDRLWFKRNRTGQFRFKWFRVDGDNREQDNARAVVRIEVTTKKN